MKIVLQAGKITLALSHAAWQKGTSKQMERHMAEAFNFDRLASVAPAAHRLHEAALVAFYLNGLPGTKNANRDRVAVIDAMFRQIASDLGYEVVRKPDAERIREFRDDVKAFISDHDHGLGPDVARLRSAVPSFDALPA